MYTHVHVHVFLEALRAGLRSASHVEVGHKPDNIFVVHLREQLHLPSDAGHHLTPATDTDLLQRIEAAIKVVTNLQRLQCTCTRTRSKTEYMEIFVGQKFHHMM